MTLENVNVKMLHDKVLIRTIEVETMTSSGIYIPETAKEKPQKGLVISAGNGIKDEPMQVKAGDTVMYGKYSGTEVKINNQEYLIVKQSDIFMVL